ncbi:GNAT family N-acetyltransferase [uncultured Gemmiger sp.]|uniref:GNAT family N-acetyltransferase n=1 Tax=uncultured Gemmiger sp. TaxID=1623490 RepID=UPI0025E66C13|nr:GNAT family N-acetyltransferase [uncultured Gemmiger sp.]
MTIRRASLKDMPRIHELLAQVEEVHHRIRPDLFKGGGRKYTDEELAGILVDDTRPILAAVDENDRLLGYAFCIFQQKIGDNIMTDVKTLYIDDLCVDETLRGQHIGRALYDAAVQYAKNLGCYNLTLNVWASNDTAHRFYESCGLRPLKYGMEVIL